MNCFPCATALLPSMSIIARASAATTAGKLVAEARLRHCASLRMVFLQEHTPVRNVYKCGMLLQLPRETPSVALHVCTERKTEQSLTRILSDRISLLPDRKSTRLNSSHLGI